MAKDIFDRNYFSPVKDKQLDEFVDKDDKKDSEDDSSDFILNNFVDDKDKKTNKNKKRIKSNFKLKKTEKREKKRNFGILRNSKLIFILMIFALAIFNTSMIYNDFFSESKDIIDSVNLTNDGKYLFSMVEVSNTSVDTTVTYFEFIRYYFSNKPIISISYDDSTVLNDFFTKYLQINFIGFVIINFLIYLLLFKLIELFLTGLFILYSIIASKNEFKDYKLLNIVIKRSMFMIFPVLFGLLLIPESYLGYLFYILFIIIYSLVIIERKVLK